MKRIDIVYNRLRELSNGDGATTIELAEALGLARPNVSDDLNRLCDEGLAIKEGTKPVRYRAIVKEKPKSVIDQFAGKFPSLAQVAEQAKAAVLYPPRGMPILILGETGTGKSLFAKLVHSFACETKDDDSLPFVIFNCADYAENPSLLVSILFGSRKGAYTGADADRQGLIEKADGGMLFLDEIHRLPPEGQEMLFSFLDRGTFRRLGDAETELSANVGIITATTETPASALLRTFVRRIPMVIRMPSLEERGMDERLELIRGFYEGEAARLGLPIHASVNSIRSLLGYPCPNNVGQLKTDIQLLCARAYSDYVSKKKTSVQIVTANLPPHIKEGLFSGIAHREIWNKLADVGSRFCVFAPEDDEVATMFDARDRLNVYELIDLRMREMHAGGVTESEVEQKMDEYIRSYFSRFCRYQNETTTLDSIVAMAEPDVARAIADIIAFAERKLGREFTPSIKTGIAMHTMNAIKRVKAGKTICSKEFNRIRRDHPAEFAAAIECLTIIDHMCEVSMPLEEATFLSFFFLLDEDRTIAGAVRPVTVIVMAHGDSTASSMAKACNTLLGLTVAHGIDVPLSEPPSAGWAKLRAFVTAQEGNPDVLLLVDMGSLTNLGRMLETELRIRSKTLTMTSTIHVLQAARKASEGLGLERIYADVRDIRDTLTTEPSTPAKTGERGEREKKYIVTLCATGEGTALMLKDTIAARLSFDRSAIRIINLGIAGETDIDSRLRRIANGGQIVFIVSPFHVNMDIPQFTPENIGIDTIRMQAILDRAALLDKISDSFADSFATIDSDAAFHAANAIIVKIESAYGRSLLDSVRTGIFCHIACMLERLKSGKDTPEFPDAKRFLADNQALFNIVRAEATRLESRFAVTIPDNEICHIASFFHPDNCIA